jgi:hypothetical protein
MILFDLVGLAGVACVLSAYFLIQTGRIQAQQPLYPSLNCIGSLGILISLYKDWNLSAFVINSLWVLIGGYGLWKALRLRNKS